MGIRPRIWPVAFLAAMTVGNMTDTAFAQRRGRSIVAARQQVRAALLVAMADDKLTSLEKRSLLRKGKRLLDPAELAALERKLDELSARQEAASTPASPKVAGKERIERVEPKKSVEPTTQTASTAAEGEGQAKSVAYNEPTDPGDQPVDQADEGGAPTSEGNPFQDEKLMESPATLQDLTTMAAEDFPTLAESYEEFAAGCGMFVESFDGFFAGFGPAGAGERTFISLSSTVDAFKGPMDLDNLNGNFGLQFGVNYGFVLAEHLGFAVQAGTSGVISDFHGTQYTGSEIRAQNFTTVGLSQRVPLGGARLRYGFAFDWLYDDYFADFKMTQWRVKLSYDLTPSTQIGIWSCIPDEGDTVPLGDPEGPRTFGRFKPVAQGNLYFSRCLGNGTALTGWIGLAEEPGQFVFGGDARIPISPQWSFVGNFNYVLPSASDVRGQDEEMWNVSLGIELTLGHGRNHCLARGLAPMFPLANNGTFAVRRY